MKKGFWSSDWFVGLIFSLVFLLLAYGLYAGRFAGLETAAYDMGVRASQTRPDPQVAVIAIDDQSIANIGRWPWPRDLEAQMIDRLREGGARVIGSTIFFSEAQVDPGKLFIQDLIKQYDGSSLGKLAPVQSPDADAVAAGTDSPAESGTGQPGMTNDPTAGSLTMTSAPAATGVPHADTPEEPAATALPPAVTHDLKELRRRMGSAVDALSTDQKLAASVNQAGNVVLPMLMRLQTPLGRPDNELPPFLLASAITNVTPGPDGNVPAIQADAVTPPIQRLGKAAAAIGHLNDVLDVDGTQRSEALVVNYYDVMFPSLALAVAARSLNLGPEDIHVTLGEGVSLGNLDIKTTPHLRMYNRFYPDLDGHHAIPEDSFYDVFTGRIPADKYRNKIVLIGATAAGVGDSFPTPVSANMAPVEIVAQTVSSILNEDFFTRPDWAPWLERAVLALLLVYIVFLLPRLKAGWAALASLGLLLGMVVAEFTLMGTRSVWIQLMVPAVFLVSGHLFMTIKLFRVTEKIRVRSEAEGAESNKMLGLAFQGQGQLDMAFDKFRKCPLDDAMMDLLYNLALDYERKRQFNKAGAVYGFMAEYNPNYRDLQQKLKRSKQMENTVVLGGGQTGSGTLILDSGDVQKPMLGRYEVEKELGKGAMGVVYLGRDPKINRVVAIKTMALSQEFEADELDDVKQRFFREAETAGRLNHPNIVTIFDAGEEHDLAYIAMEFLKGKDLTGYCKGDTLLPVDKVLDIMARSADALDYAHAQNVVHRDIKPANIMYEPESSGVKITDFGIARITDSSKTKTGMVLGTPSYMSPEQLSGKKVDGRSDLFSLGVTMYQMLTGKLPFQADSMATLMYKIANEPHPRVLTVRPDLPDCLEAIIDRVLHKEADNRYQKGAELAEDIRTCANKLSQG
ncbi:MAG: serine/threonine-protein kinase [Gammaproteobacteria bacterium]